MNIYFDKNTAVISGEYIDIKAVFDCGQFFRYFNEDDKHFIIAADKLAYISNTERGFELYPTNEEEFMSFWYPFLRLDMSYTATEEEFLKDEILKETIPYCHGMRILRQREFETLISFIISANNNIKRIKKIIEALCVKAGEKCITDGREYHAFPTPEAISALSLEELYALGLGYRAPYINKTAASILEGYDLNSLHDMEYEQAKKQLCTLMGVGPKVADCILLFAYNKFSAFPVDTWVKKILTELYDFTPKSNAEAVSFAHNRFGENAGIAQQYLFHYMRMRENQ